MKDMNKAAGTQNPQDAIEKETGTYKDPVQDVPVEERFGMNVMPMAPGPQPIRGSK